MLEPFRINSPELSRTLPRGIARASGLWGLIRLDGGPLAAADLAALGLPARGDSAVIAGFDRQAPHLVQRLDDHAGQTVLVGWLADRDGLAARLGLDRRAGDMSLVRAALVAFGADTPGRMLGEWCLAHRDHDGETTVMIAATRRDRVFFAQSGPHLALAPDLFALGGLSWVHDDIDPAGLVMTLGRAALRRAKAWRTMLRAVEQVPAGGSLRIPAQGALQRHRASALVPQPRWQGSRRDLLAEARSIIQAAVRDRLAVQPHAAILLSGGLDSSLLTWIAATAPDRRYTIEAITSISPPGSGLADEQRFARMVTDRLGLVLHGTAPPETANPYRPPDHVLAGGEASLLANRHCLTEAMHLAAIPRGPAALVNGTYGEMTLTARLPQLRQTIAALWRRPAAPGPGPCHVRLAPHRLAALPAMLDGVSEDPWEIEPAAPHGLFGYQPGCAKALAHANAFHASALRMEFPYRDVRLLRLFAGVPIDLMHQCGKDRGVARAMMAGHVPDAIRLRRTGMPADPGHLRRLQGFADATRLRLPLFRRGGAGDWLDLDWLDTALARVAAQGPAGVTDANAVQLTAIAAEFLCWWQDRRTGRPNEDRR